VVRLTTRQLETNNQPSGAVDYGLNWFVRLLLTLQPQENLHLNTGQYWACRCIGERLECFPGNRTATEFVLTIMSAKAAEFFTYIAMSALDAAWSSKPAKPAIPSDAAIRRIVAERVKTIAGADDGIGIVVGVVGTDGPRIISYGDSRSGCGVEFRDAADSAPTIIFIQGYEA